MERPGLKEELTGIHPQSAVATKTPGCSFSKPHLCGGAYKPEGKKSMLYKKMLLLEGKYYAQYMFDAGMDGLHHLEEQHKLRSKDLSTVDSFYDWHYTTPRRHSCTCERVFGPSTTFQEKMMLFP